MDVLTFETCWAVNSEIIKQVTSSWSIFIQVHVLLVGSLSCPQYLREKRQILRWVNKQRKWKVWKRSSWSKWNSDPTSVYRNGEREHDKQCRVSRCICRYSKWPPLLYKSKYSPHDTSWLMNFSFKNYVVNKLITSHEFYLVIVPKKTVRIVWHHNLILFRSCIYATIRRIL